MTTNETVLGIERGKYLGSGAYSTVYEYPPDDSKVVMNGDFSDDILKLNLYASIGGLHGVNVDHANDRYAAVLTRMQDKRYSNSAERQIRDMVNVADNISQATRESDWNKDNFYYERLSHLASDPQINDKAASLILFLIECGIHDYHWDNHSGNWLIDSDGDCLPLDVFNANSNYIRDKTSELTDNISDKIKDHDDG